MVRVQSTLVFQFYYLVLQSANKGLTGSKKKDGYVVCERRRCYFGNLNTLYFVPLEIIDHEFDDQVSPPSRT
jgi:hypothetical protein